MAQMYQRRSRPETWQPLANVQRGEDEGLGSLPLGGGEVAEKERHADKQYSGLCPFRRKESTYSQLF